MINIFHFVIRRYFYLQKTDIGIQLNTNKAVYIYITLVFAHKKEQPIGYSFLYLYTQVTSICLIQSEVTELNSRKTTKRNSELFPSCLTQEVGSVTRSQRASVLSSQTLLTILNVEPLYLRIVAAPEN